MADSTAPEWGRMSAGWLAERSAETRAETTVDLTDEIMVEELVEKMAETSADSSDVTEALKTDGTTVGSMAVQWADSTADERADSTAEQMDETTAEWKECVMESQRVEWWADRWTPGLALRTADPKAGSSAAERVDWTAGPRVSRGAGRSVGHSADGMADWSAEQRV